MLSINIYVRFALMALLLIGGTVLAILFGFWYAFPFLLAGLILLVGYILLGTVQSASKALQDNDFLKAESRLNLCLSPRLLYATNRAYYYMLKGTIASSTHRPDEAEAYLKKAQSIKIPTANEKAMLELQLANIAAQKGKWTQAQNHFREAKKLQVTQAEIKEQIKMFEKALNQQKQARSAQMGNKGAMRPGGKRRRPKMR